MSHWQNDGITHFVADSAQIGYGTKIWHYAIILDDVVIGHDCSVGSRAEIGRGSQIGDNTRIGSGVFLPANSRIGANVFIGPNVTATDDKYPRVNNPQYIAQPPAIGSWAAIGAGAVLLPGVNIGEHAMVAAGAIVTSDVEPYGCVKCEPARAFERTF